MTRSLAVTAALLAALFTMILGASSAGAAGLRLGFTDLGTVQNDPAERPLELEHLKSTRATTIRMMWKWSDVEKVKPPTDQLARDPAWSGYDWSLLDAALRDIATARVDPLVTIYEAPDWWEGPDRPAVSPTAPRGTWRPDAAAFGRFMHAAATRYSGSYPDPLRPGQNLPRVPYWQAWNEPNLPNSLSPQWIKTGSGFKPASPAWYKPMLNAAYTEIKSASRSATVLTAGTAPFGEPQAGGTRMPAALFVRELLCVTGRAKPKAKNCRKNPAKFDILAHHPYPIGPPGRHAINPDDVVIPDFDKLTKPLAVAVKAGNVFPKMRKPVWATEMSWDSSPPDPGGIDALRQARYAAGAMYVLWRQGVSAMIWWNLRDDAKGQTYTNTLQSGVFFRGPTVAQDTPKPSFTAFRFPFTVYGSKRGAKLWGIAPAAGTVTIQRQAGNVWKNVRTVKVAGGRVFQTRIAAKRGTRFRANQAGEASIDAKVF